MKFATLITAFAAVATVSAAVVDTNANRMARGLPPKAPAKRATGVSPAKRAGPSSTPECKPLLQSCAVNSECCSDLCVLGLCT